MDKKYFEILIDGEWELIELSDEDYNNIIADLNGELNKEYKVTTLNGNIIEVGIIDNIRIIRGCKNEK